VRISPMPYSEVVQISRVTTGTTSVWDAADSAASAAPPNRATQPANITHFNITPPPGTGKQLLNVGSAAGKSQIARVSAKIEAGWEVLRTLFAVLQRQSEQLQPVTDQPEAELPCDALLQLLDLLVGELDHLAGLDVNKMVVMAEPC